METVYKIKLELESTDEVDLATFIHYVAEDIAEGRLLKEQTAGMVDGTVKYDKEERCEHCNGTGEVNTDEDDGEGHIMRGVGTTQCICQKQ